MAATWAVWLRAGGGAVQARQTQTGKVKRTDPRRGERLIEALDEDEIVELETLLLAREDADARSGQR